MTKIIGKHRVKAIITFTFTFTFTFCTYAAPAPEPEPAKFQSSGPLNIRNQMPLYLFYLAPTPDRANTLDKGKIEVDTAYHVSNTILQQRPLDGQPEYTPAGLIGIVNGAQYREWWVYIDTEVNRFDINVSYGLLDNLEFSADIPYYIFSGGYLDGFIENCENLFSFIKTPNARRERGRYQYEYDVRNKGNQLIMSTSKPNGFGEISAYIKYLFFKETKHAPCVSGRVGIKFPTAQDELLGSKKFDYAIGILMDKQIFERFFLYFNLNYVRVQRPAMFDKLPKFEDNMFHSVFGLEYFITNKSSLIFQTTANTSVYYEGVPSTGRDPVVLTLGFNHNFNDKVSWQIAMDENTNSAAPDFGLFTSLKVKL